MAKKTEAVSATATERIELDVDSKKAVRRHVRDFADDLRDLLKESVAAKLTELGVPKELFGPYIGYGIAVFKSNLPDWLVATKKKE